MNASGTKTDSGVNDHGQMEQAPEISGDRAWICYVLNWKALSKSRLGIAATMGLFPDRGGRNGLL